jgi:hypothetical protein
MKWTRRASPAGRPWAASKRFQLYGLVVHIYIPPLRRKARGNMSLDAEGNSKRTVNQTIGFALVALIALFLFGATGLGRVLLP